VKRSVFLCGAVFCLLAAGIPVSGYGQDIYEFVLKWGSLGSGTGQFNFPTDMAVDAQGNVYVADTRNFRIQKFDSLGNPLMAFGYYLNFPHGVTVDSNGNIYASVFYSSDNGEIKKFGPDGQLVLSWRTPGQKEYGVSPSIMGLGIDQFDNIYVADAGCQRVFVYKPDGELRDTIKGAFLRPYDVAVDSAGNVYVADIITTPWGVDGVYKIDPAGNSTFWPSIGPFGIFIDSRDQIFITSQSMTEVKVLDTDGNLLTSFGGPGYGDGEFRGLWGIAVSPDGFVYVSDHGLVEGDVFLPRIQKFAKSISAMFASLEGEIQTLIDDGKLDAPDGGHLLNFVTLAKNRHLDGHGQAACALLGAFINNVESLIKKGRLSAEDGGALIAAAEALIESMTT